ncbi:MAG: hypothetical protein WBQ17_05800 [Rhizomicrobium sp.]|jgi:hypothetical protein
MTDDTAFALSRIQAEGWNAARKFLTDKEPGDEKIAALNPYKASAERARWTAGFNAALNRR